MSKILHNRTEGFALLLAIIISGVVLSIGLVILSVTLKQLNLGISTIGSERAFQAAAAGMDCVRYLRNDQPDNFTQNERTVSINCFGLSGRVMEDLFKGTSGDYEFQQVFQTRFDWDTGATPVSEQCIQMTIYVQDASGGDKTLRTVQHGDIDCADGDVCTNAYVQGYNLPCANIANNPTAVVRELSAEF